MQAHTPFFRPPAARPPTLRRRVALAVTRSFGARTRTLPATEHRLAESFEQLDLDQRVREVGEW